MSGEDQDIFDYSQLQDGCVILEPRDFFEPSVIRYDSEKNRLVYSYDFWVKIFMEEFQDDVDPYIAAIEHIEYNVLGCIDGMDNAPIVIYDHDCEVCE